MSLDLVTWCIDFGTSYTSVAVSSPGTAPVAAAVEPGTVDHRRMKSVVLVSPDRSMVVGLAAHHHAQTAPERFIVRPKSALGTGFDEFGDGVCTVLLDGRMTNLPAPAVCGRLLSEAYTRVRRTHPAPDRLVLTHPAGWDDARIGALRRAAAIAGLLAPTLLAEPVAAARALAARHADRLLPGTLYLVYDLGGGTCDIAVLRRADAGADEVVGCGGVEHVGGHAFDNVLLQQVYAHLADLDETAAERLCFGSVQRDEPDWNEPRGLLFDDLTAARELLSDQTGASLLVGWPDGHGRRTTELRVERSHFEIGVKPLLDNTLAECERILEAAGLSTGDLSAVLLTGGASRTPIVADTLAAWSAMEPIDADDLADVAVAVGGTMPQRTKPVPPPPPPPAAEATWRLGGRFKLAFQPIYDIVVPETGAAVVATATNKLIRLELADGTITRSNSVGDGLGYKMNVTYPRVLTLNPRGDRIAAGTDDRGTVEAWRPDTGFERRLADGYPIVMGRLCASVALDNDGDLYVVRGRLLECWCHRERRWQRRVSAGTRVVLCPSGTGIIVAEPTHAIRLGWAGDFLTTVASGRVAAMAASASTLFLAQNAGVTILPNGYANERSSVSGPSAAAPSRMAASRLGKEFAVGHADGSVTVWLDPTGRPAELPFTSAVTALAFSRQGQRLVVGHADGTVRWWERI